MKVARKAKPIVCLIAVYLAVALLAVAKARGGEFLVTAVIRDFPMKAGEDTPKDFYISAGTNNGLRKGAVLDAMRKLTVYDNINARANGDTSVKIAKLKIIHVDPTTSIARLVKMNDKDSTPVSGYESVMIGDAVVVADKQ